MIPPQIAAAGLLLTAMGGFGAGWTVQGWRCRAAQAAALSEAAKQADAIAAKANVGAAAYERAKSNEVTKQVIRENEVRTYYKDRLVPADCAITGPARSLLESARSEANSRVGGQPSGPVPAGPAPAGPSSIPGP